MHKIEEDIISASKAQKIKIVIIINRSKILLPIFLLSLFLHLIIYIMPANTVIQKNMLKIIINILVLHYTKNVIFCQFKV